jgi:hypothetical protein
MDTNLGILYIVRHETLWHTPDIGEAKGSGHSLPESRPHVSFGGCETRCLAKFGGAMASNLSTRGIPWTSSQGNPRTPVAARRKAETTIAGDFGRRCFRSWLYDRSLDVEADRGGRPTGVWCSVLNLQCLEVDERSRMELPEAREAGSRTERESHPLLATARLASHKKKPQDLEPIWRSLMRAASSLFQSLPVPGPRRDELPFSGRQAPGQKSRRSRHLRSLQSIGISPSTHVSIPRRTSDRGKWSSFSRSSFGTCAATWSCFGTEVWFTEQALWVVFSRNIHDCMSIFFHPMLQNSIRTNSSGRISNDLLPTVSQEMYVISDNSWNHHCENSGIHSVSFDHAFMPLACQENRCIHYLVYSQ